MPEEPRTGLDNPAFHGRLRHPDDWKLSSRAASPPPARRRDYTSPSVRLAQVPSTPPPPQSPVPAPVQPPSPAGPARRFMHESDQPSVQPLHTHRYSKLQVSLAGMAAVVFVAGLGVSLQTLQTNRTAAAQVSALSKKADKQSSPVPSTTKPSNQAFNNYAVAPDLPRYLKIPALGVNARVLQVGIDSSGAIGTPHNVFDTAWYTGSAKPGQPGATLIDGHVSSWTTHGVFYGIKTLKTGDTLQIVRGDGALLTYRVVKTQVYPSGNVDMQAAITPVTAGKSGLNLITCTGQVQKGTNEFNQRVIVFAEQVI